MTANTYNVLSQLGHGTFGTVYLCERKHNKMKIVVKEINIGSNKENIASAKSEVEILKTVTHPNIIRFYDNFVKDDKFCILMEYAARGNLYEFLKGRKTQLSYIEVMKIFCQIVSGLNHIHQKNVIHRDLKAENIFLTGLNENVVKIGDFGISKLLQSPDEKTSTAIGTTNYLAPEICDGLPYGKKSDIWSLGCLLYELCALERLFDGSISEIVSAIKSGKHKHIDASKYGTGFQKIIDDTVQLDPEKRPNCVNIMSNSIISVNIAILNLNLGNIRPKEQTC